MSRNLNARKNGIGEPSSKYGYDRDGSQFEADIQRHLEESERLYKEFVDWMKERNVDPETVRRMFIKFYYEFIE